MIETVEGITQAGAFTGVDTVAVIFVCETIPRECARVFAEMAEGDGWHVSPRIDLPDGAGLRLYKDGRARLQFSAPRMLLGHNRDAVRPARLLEATSVALAHAEDVGVRARGDIGEARVVRADLVKEISLAARTLVS